MTPYRHIAVLGSGIMGSAAALSLARRSVKVTLFDATTKPFHGASRWNEGKIHLGYLYSASTSLNTARQIMPGGLLFKDLTEELIGRPLASAVTSEDDIYVVHRNSVITAENMEPYLHAVTNMAGTHPHANRYFVPLSNFKIQRLTHVELDSKYDMKTIVAGFRLPERSIATQWLADRFVEALDSEVLINQNLQTRIEAVERVDRGRKEKFMIKTQYGMDGPYDAVINALWEGRLKIDASLGLRPPPTWSHRFRLSIFLRTNQTLNLPSTVICVGPFGDIKNYNGRDFYLSWYSAGLIAEGHAIQPPDTYEIDLSTRQSITEDIFRHLSMTIRDMDSLKNHLESIRLEGGWVYAAGRGSLADPTSTIHSRDNIGFNRIGNYVSVDTGKYSIAPWLARSIAVSFCGE